MKRLLNSCARVPRPVKSLARSQAARRRAAAAAAMASVGAGILGTQSAEAGIVTLDLTSVGSPGVNITGVNAGLANGNTSSVGNFQISGNNLEVRNNFYGFTGLVLFSSGGGIAISGGGASPRNFLGDATIGSGVTFSNQSSQTSFKASYYSAPAFGNNSYLGFKTSQGNYGWIKATWNGTDTFELYSAAYETVAGVSIAAGAVAVPEPSTTALLGLGALALGAGVVRKQRAARRTQAAAAMSA